jgi:hypothetical protein
VFLLSSQMKDEAAGKLTWEQLVDAQAKISVADGLGMLRNKTKFARFATSGFPTPTRVTDAALQQQLQSQSLPFMKIKSGSAAADHDVISCDDVAYAVSKVLTSTSSRYKGGAGGVFGRRVGGCVYRARLRPVPKESKEPMKSEAAAAGTSGGEKSASTSQAQVTSSTATQPAKANAKSSNASNQSAANGQPPKQQSPPHESQAQTQPPAQAQPPAQPAPQPKQRSRAAPKQPAQQPSPLVQAVQAVAPQPAHHQQQQQQQPPQQHPSP